jgi:hypothetical protein
MESLERELATLKQSSAALANTAVAGTWNETWQTPAAATATTTTDSSNQDER